MTDEPKQPPALTEAQLTKLLEDARAEDLIEKAEAMSEEELDKRMAESGLTDNDRQQSLARQRLRFEAARDKELAVAKAEEAKTAAPAGFGSRVTQWLMIAMGLGTTTAATATVAMYLKFAELVSQLPAETHAGASPDGGTVKVRNMTADLKRSDALRLYAMGNYARCIDDIDEAARIDPGPDNDDPALKSARERSVKALAEEKKKEP